MKCKDIIEKYLSFLRENFIVEETDLGCYIITPHIGYNGEPIDLYIEEAGGGIFRLTDSGNTLVDLSTVNVEVNSGKGKEIFEELLRLYEIKEEMGELFIELDSIEELPRKLNSFIDVIHSILDLEYLKVPAREKKFSWMVHEYCSLNDLKHHYMKQIAIRNVKHTIDILSIDFKNLIQTIGTSTEVPSTMKRFTEVKIFPFIEIETNPQEREKYYRAVIYDDSIKWDNESMAIIENHSDELFSWKERKKLRSLLTE